MSNKIDQSLAALRQIPSYIKDEYPAFVEFIKIYYDFLKQTQNQNIERYRDIDETIDDFIEKFQYELASNIPLNLVSDKRTLMKNIREFYLSKGSEASYKFLFRILFGKDPELFYPSTQMLRVSDGKWKREVSIFVKVTSTADDFSLLNGNFITIQTNVKSLRSYVEKVVQYSEDVFELFIQTTFVNEIEIGSTISSSVEGVDYTGIILTCPTKFTVLEKGSGFTVGDRYRLKTSIGDGCLIKITKTDSNGGILAIQPISFALDYNSRFWSYLSNKKLDAIEYGNIFSNISLSFAWSSTAGNQVITLTRTNHGLVTGASLQFSFTASGYTPPNGSYTITVTGVDTFTITVTGTVFTNSGTAVSTTTNATPFNDPTGGAIESGLAIKQTYMFSDNNIPLPSEAYAGDRLFADSTYVGEIVGEFYDDQTNVIDDSLALIEIELGSVAKYPGYYINQDGFISDEMYIQDGTYYQSYSYVIRVEEELKKYSTIIKSILHPAGMKMFSEYYIFNALNLETVIDRLSSLLQFEENALITDGGAYVSNGSTIFVDRPIKNLDALKRDTQLVSSKTIKSFNKLKGDTPSVSSSSANSFNKLRQDTQSVTFTKAEKSFNKLKQETQPVSSSATKSLSKLKGDTPSVSSSATNSFNKLKEDTQSVAFTSVVNSFGKLINIDNVSIGDQSEIALGWIIPLLITLIEDASLALSQSVIEEDVTVSLSLTASMVENAYAAGDYFGDLYQAATQVAQVP